VLPFPRSFLKVASYVEGDHGEISEVVRKSASELGRSRPKD